MNRASLAVGIAFAVLACDRTHMTPHYGEASRDAFRAQVIAPDAGNARRPEQPLDPEEAAIVSRTYQKSLGPKENADPGGRPSQLLVVPPPSQGGAAPAPAGTGMSR